MYFLNLQLNRLASLLVGCSGPLRDSPQGRRMAHERMQNPDRSCVQRATERSSLSVIQNVHLGNRGLSFNQECRYEEDCWVGVLLCDSSMEHPTSRSDPRKFSERTSETSLGNDLLFTQVYGPTMPSLAEWTDYIRELPRFKTSLLCLVS